MTREAGKIETHVVLIKQSPWKKVEVKHMPTEFVNLGQEVRKQNVTHAQYLPLPELGKVVKGTSSGKNWLIYKRK